MKRNVGIIDRLLRFTLGIALLWIGTFTLDGADGNWIGILVILLSLLPFYMFMTGSCFVFRRLKIHSLSKKECEVHGNPYPQNSD